MTPANITRTCAAAASGILLLTAAYHATGYTPVTRAVQGAAISPFFSAGFKGLWILFSIHLAIIAIVILLFGIRIRPATRSALSICSALLISTAITLFVYLGAFIGAMLIAGAAILVMLSAMLSPPDAG